MLTNISFKLLKGILFFIGFLFVFSGSFAQEKSKPNIVMIMADDLGYGDLKCYNEKSLIPTPNLDKLASESIMLTDAYCPVSVCSPTRYSLMTGQYSWRSWRKTGVMRNYEPSMIDSELLTLPEMLQQAGYSTAGFGKWHLGTTFPTTDGNEPAGYGEFYAENNGANLDFSKPVTDGPVDHGFDKWLGFSCASECWLFEDTMIMGAILHGKYTIDAAPVNKNIQEVPLQDYLPFITDRTISYLKERKTQQPFFLYFAPYVPHIPLAVSEEYRGKTIAGLYGDYVHELDFYIGKVLNTLDSLKLSDNTIILFASDNGSQFKVTSKELDLENASNSPEENKFMEIEGHHPNGMLRGTKWTAWEGGVRTPFLAKWPGRFPSGASNSQLFALTDVITSIASIVDYDLPENSAPDSYDLSSVFYGENKNIRKMVVVQSSGNRLGLRHGDWKFIGTVDFKSKTISTNDIELYNLKDDITESNNISTEYPEKVKEMRSTLEEILVKESVSKK